jgi:hypothetical protein
MKDPVPRVLAVVLLAIGLAVALALLVWRPVTAPTVSGSSAEPAESSDRAASSEPNEMPAIPEPQAWAEVTWDEPIVQPFGAPDVLFRVDGMVGTDDLLVGWGRTPMPGRNQFNDMGAIFLSRDAATWATVPVEHGVNALNASTIVDVAIGSRALIAVGGVCCDPEAAAVWRSTDGRAWERLEVEGAFDGGGADSVLAIDDGWLMLVSLPDGSAVVHSADGVAWERVLEAQATRASRGIQAIARGPDGFIAVGQVEGPDESYDGAVWSSDDGRSWERLALEDQALAGDGEVYLHDVVGHAGGFLATGILGTAEQRRTCEELALLASVVDLPLPQSETATSCVSGDEQQWTSLDGRQWQRVEAGGAPGPIEFRVARPGGPGLVVLGEASGPASPDTMLFGSDDGALWRVLSDAEPMLTDVAVALVVQGDEIVAVTEHWDGEETTRRVWRGRAG